MSRKSVICLRYNIKTSRDAFCYNEYFAPYSVDDIKESPYFKKFCEKFKLLFNEHKENNLDFLPKDFCTNVGDEQILPDTANILMDAIYCVSTSLWDDSWPLYGGYWYAGKIPSFFPVDEELGVIDPYYVGLYTELIKYQVKEIKLLISLLVYLQNVSDNENTPDVNLAFEEIKENFIFNDLGIFNDSKESSTITGCLCRLCSYKNFQPPVHGFSIEIDLQNFDRFISLLRKYKPISGDARFYDGKNCFCLAFEGWERFFCFKWFWRRL